MAALVLKTMGQLNEGHKAVYPLFHKGSKPIETSIQCSDAVPEGFPPDQLSAPIEKSPRQNTTLLGAVSNSSQETIPVPSTPQTLDHQDQASLEVDLNDGRRKRRKTTSPEGESVSESNEDVVEGNLGTFNRPQRKGKAVKNYKGELSAAINAVLDNANDDDMDGRSSQTPTKGKRKQLKKPPIIVSEKGNSTPPINVGPTSKEIDRSFLQKPEPSNNLEPVANKPKKLLKFNPKTGTIGSPPLKKPTRLVATNSKIKGSRKGPLIIRYGTGLPLPESLGLKINGILNKSSIETRASNDDTRHPRMEISQQKPAKSLHPLFLGKRVSKLDGQKKSPAVVDLTGDDKRNVTKTSVTPFQHRPRSPTRKSTTPFPTFGSSTKILKFPGASNPIWPWKGMVHVRGYGESLKSNEPPLSLSRKGGRGKYSAIQVPLHENVIHELMLDLKIGSVLKELQDFNVDEYPLPPDCLRLPKKHQETGKDIQRRVQRQLRARVSLADSTESSTEDAQTHAALIKMYNLIGTSLSAFEQGKCETQTWNQKYSPKSASDVLQNGPEATILKSWLQNLIVQSVEGGSRDRASSLNRRTGTTKANALTKRKRKPKNLDDFIVSDDEETSDLEEIPGSQTEDSPLPGHRGLKTLVRTVDKSDPSKVKNAILLSGPHGCGKSASVYAVAKELGFEVFEISPGSRRSGKDIMDKVGDMTRNHLVQRHNSLSDSVNIEQQRIDPIDAALANDLQSGRQGTMNSFFKTEQPKPKAKTSSIPSEQPSAEKAAPDSKVPPKKQKQSLILIEEADILYEEDKQFWATVMSLIAQSKRPIVLTCNNEAVLPELVVHAKLRYSPPPTDLAVDYLLLCAACEGHSLHRGALEALYEGRQYDLRAALAELNFWCQFAVGDPRGGFDWYHRRSSNLKAQHDRIRVVSEDTYQAGMGWLSQDFLQSHIRALDVGEETLHEAWDGWNLDLGDWHSHLRIEEWASNIDAHSESKSQKLDALNIYSDLVELLSATDLCSGGTFAPEHMIELDLSLPRLGTKVRDDYVLAHPLLEASTVVKYNTLSQDMSIWMKSRSRNFFQVDQHVKHKFEVPIILAQHDEKDILRIIREHVNTEDEKLTRYDLSVAFDPIAASEKSSTLSGKLDMSCFDRTKTLIVEDLAPYIRGIVSFETRLAKDRIQLSNLLSEGGRKAKKMRTTRSALSALEGGARNSTRKERYCGEDTLNSELVLRTGKQSWLDALEIETAREVESLPTESRRSSLADVSKGESEIEV